MRRVHDNGRDPALWSVPDMPVCIDACLTCRRACLEAINTILSESEDEPKVGLVLLLVDCADICQININFMLRESPFAARTCATCAVVCDRCVLACVMDGIPGLASCVEACRHCARMCRLMAAAL